MVFGAVCGLVPDAPSSGAGARKAAPVSPLEAQEGFAPLKSRDQFERVFAEGRRRRTGGITVLTIDTDHPVTRVGLVVNRRVGNAVLRNRVKRRLRAALRSVDLGQGHDHVVIATPAVATADFGTLVRWLEIGCGHRETEA